MVLKVVFTCICRNGRKGVSGLFLMVLTAKGYIRGLAVSTIVSVNRIEPKKPVSALGIFAQHNGAARFVEHRGLLLGNIP